MHEAGQGNGAAHEAHGWGGQEGLEAGERTLHGAEGHDVYVHAAIGHGREEGACADFGPGDHGGCAHAAIGHAHEEDPGADFGADGHGVYRHAAIGHGREEDAGADLSPDDPCGYCQGRALEDRHAGGDGELPFDGCRADGDRAHGLGTDGGSSNGDGTARLHQ